MKPNKIFLFIFSYIFGIKLNIDRDYADVHQWNWAEYLHHRINLKNIGINPGANHPICNTPGIEHLE